MPPTRSAGDITARYCSVRDLTEQLAAPLSPEDQTAQSMPNVSPTKWHRAHTTWFFETFVLERFDPAHVPFEPSYRMLFNSYYQAVGEQYPRPERGTITRPGAAEVGEYRAAIDARVVALLRHVDDIDDVDADELTSLIELGLQHEQQHQELLLMDIKHVLSKNPLEPTYLPQRRAEPDPRSPVTWERIDGGLVEIGHDSSRFSFDNELPRHHVHLDPYEIADRLVSAGEWCEFIADGGYDRPELWISDGWDTVRARRWEAPLYWHRRDDRWWVHTLGGTSRVTDAEPVCHISFYEADAYARWAGARLPTEFEWEHAACTMPARPAEFALDRLHPTAPVVDGTPLRQMSGDCWQWTASAYLPYPGFAPAAGAVGEYNGKFMSGQMVLRGGAAITPSGHARPSYRNFFRPAERWPMTGLRLARGDTIR